MQNGHVEHEEEVPLRRKRVRAAEEDDASALETGGPGARAKDPEPEPKSGRAAVTDPAERASIESELRRKESYAKLSIRYEAAKKLWHEAEKRRKGSVNSNKKADKAKDDALKLKLRVDKEWDNARKSRRVREKNAKKRKATSEAMRSIERQLPQKLFAAMKKHRDANHRRGVKEAAHVLHAAAPDDDDDAAPDAACVAAFDVYVQELGRVCKYAEYLQK
jgi:hypothetical protein